MSALATPSSSMSYSNSSLKKQALLGTLVENGKNLEVLGWIVWWNIRDVSISRDKFLEALLAAGINPKYAKEHNARASLLRALATLREQKIVRTLHEDDIYAKFQFTAEVKSGSGEQALLSYHPQVIITVDKANYVSTRNKDENAFRNSIVSVVDLVTSEAHAQTDLIKDQLSNAFTREMNSYTSSDLTRYIQNIFTDQADIVSLRQQGSIYFVPAAYSPIVDGIKILVSMIGGVQSRFDAVPMPDTKDTRKTVGDSFAEEVAETLAKLDKEITQMNDGSKEITDKWVDFRRQTINKVKERIDMYAEVLGDKAAEMNGTIDRIGDMLKPRVLDLT